MATVNKIMSALVDDPDLETYQVTVVVSKRELEAWSVETKRHIADMVEDAARRLREEAVNGD